ncbi:hypothetical protein L3X37_03115 [Sabulilitoribacter arenilitoris]|uniref:Uncharacterized protein n=1 Tax=Wocania arenilitoris TaxID=2044858 RepID=A0AAE3ELV6_9FLAO|nr:hypothetical protein [Wocania arenilitoris]
MKRPSPKKIIAIAAIMYSICKSTLIKVYLPNQNNSNNAKMSNEKTKMVFFIKES